MPKRTAPPTIDRFVTLPRAHRARWPVALAVVPGAAAAMLALPPATGPSASLWRMLAIVDPRLAPAGFALAAAAAVGALAMLAADATLRPIDPIRLAIAAALLTALLAPVAVPAAPALLLAVALLALPAPRRAANDNRPHRGPIDWGLPIVPAPDTRPLLQMNA